MHACRRSFQLGNVEDGFLPSAFLAGLLIASIVYSELTTRYNAFRMTGVHMLLNGLHLPSQAASLNMEGPGRCMQGLALRYGHLSFQVCGSNEYAGVASKFGMCQQSFGERPP